MSRMSLPPIACFLLLSFVAMGIGAAPAHADTIYEFTATSTSPTTLTSFDGAWLQATSFSLEYVDKNGTGLLTSTDEILSFTGVKLWAPAVWAGGVTFSAVLYIPPYDLAAFTDGPSFPGGWGFSGTVIGETYTWPSAMWTYGEHPISTVPIPPAVFLLGSGLIPLAWARRKKRLG